MNITSKDDVRRVLAGILPAARASGIGSPSAEEWDNFNRKMAIMTPLSFQWFIELMSEFDFPGDILNIAGEYKTNGNDYIDETVRQESSIPNGFVPFYAVGNGDYFGLSSVGEENAPPTVAYWFHEDGHVEITNASFDEWLAELPAFLSP